MHKSIKIHIFAATQQTPIDIRFTMIEKTSKDIERTYYSIREVSRMLDLPLSTLRYWEQVFDCLRPHTNEAKTRFYTKEDVELIKKIKYLRQEQHMTLPAVEAHLKVSSEADYRYLIAQDLKKIRDELAELRAMM